MNTANYMLNIHQLINVIVDYGKHLTFKKTFVTNGEIII